MKILVGFGGNPNATDTEKWTPLVSKSLKNENMTTAHELRHSCTQI